MRLEGSGALQKKMLKALLSFETALRASSGRAPFSSLQELIVYF